MLLVFHVFCINHVPLSCAVAYTIFNFLLFEQSLVCCFFSYMFSVYYVGTVVEKKGLMVNVVGIYLY